MTDLDLRKKILAKEIKKAKAYVGASLVDAIDEEREQEYIDTLNEVLIELEKAISLLESKNNATQF